MKAVELVGSINLADFDINPESKQEFLIELEKLMKKHQIVKVDVCWSVDFEVN